MPMLVDYELHPYRLPLVEPLRLGAGTIEAREGVLVRVADDEGHEGWGDAAPLPHFSHETFSEAQRALSDLRETVIGTDWSPDAATLPRDVRHAEALSTAPPSVRYAVELALYQWCASVNGTTLPHVLTATPRAHVSLNALIIGKDGSMREKGAALRAEGYKAVKMKVGRGDLDDDIRRVHDLRAVLGEEVAIRLDANRAWTMADATRFLAAVSGCRIAYIEEPLADPVGLPALAEQGARIALDETTRDITVADLDDHAYAVAVVLKPSLVGGFEASRQMGEAAAVLGIQPVISAAYESGVGMVGLVALAAALGPTDVAAGLDTYRWLATDLLMPRLSLHGPRVDVEATMHAARTRRYEVS